MTSKSRRGFLGTSAALMGATAIAPFLGEDSPLLAQTANAGSDALTNGAEKFSTATAPHKPVRVLDTDKVPIQGAGASPSLTGWGRKVVFHDPASKDTLSILYTQPGIPGAQVHYHTFHEWAYNIKGDFTNNESTCPQQRTGPLQRFREGNFLDRPPHSLHGGERGRTPWMTSQVGSIILIMEEGGESYTVEEVTEGQQGMKYAPTADPNFKNIKQWAIPRIIDTLNKMPFQPDPQVPGLGVKWLADDHSRGFRVITRYLPAGWNSSQAPQFIRPYYYRQAHQFIFLIAGDLSIQTYKSPTEKGEVYTAKENTLIERPPMSIFGLAEGVVTKGTAVWLEATYSRGTSTAVSSGLEIEDPTYV